jgi:hypothetical protein
MRKASIKITESYTASEALLVQQSNGLTDEETVLQLPLNAHSLDIGDESLSYQDLSKKQLRLSNFLQVAQSSDLCCPSCRRINDLPAMGYCATLNAKTLIFALPNSDKDV